MVIHISILTINLSLRERFKIKYHEWQAGDRGVNGWTIMKVEEGELHDLAHFESSGSVEGSVGMRHDFEAMQTENKWEGETEMLKDIQNLNNNIENWVWNQN